MKNRNLLPLFALAVLGLAANASATTMNGHLYWTGDGGYSARVDFVYRSPAQLPPGYDPSVEFRIPGLDDLRVWIYDPVGNLLQYKQNVVDGVVDYPSFAFQFSAEQGFFTGSHFLDVGADPGYWLFGSRDSANRVVFGLASDFYTEESPFRLVDYRGTYRFHIADASVELSTLLLACCVLFWKRRR